MYHSFFGMKQRPFGATAQLHSYFPASGQEEALATLHYAIIQGRGIGLLTGPSGTGKTLVCHRLTESLESGYTTAVITNTNMTTTKALYQAILYDLSLPFHGLDEQELRLSFTDFLFGQYAGGTRTVLVVDEAQNLSVPLLEELRLLSNLEGEGDKFFQIVLAGHTRLLNVLRAPELEALQQRIGARAALTALSDEQTVAYIRQQLQCVGVLPDEVFTEDALTAVYEASAGVPRVINQVCEHSLLLAYVTESHRVDVPIVERASADLNRLAGQGTEEGPPADSSGIKAPSLRAVARFQTESVTASQTGSGICISYPCEEPQDPCLEIVTREQESSGLACCEPVTSTATIAAGRAAQPPEEAFDEEEIVVDPYAMMDAARSERIRKPPPAPQAVQIAKLLADTTSKDEGPTGPQPTAFVSVAADAPRPLTLIEAATSEEPTPVAFVESSDNPAAHEVGAGTTVEPAESTAPPILLIESRSQRMAGHLARVDVPQQTIAAGARAYRRLFTLARKS